MDAATRRSPPHEVMMPIPHAVARAIRGTLNPLVLRLAGRGSVVDLEHVGRRSGTVRHTPLMAFRHGRTVTVALTYGPDVEWLKNVRAAGRCRMRMGEQVLTLGPPSSVPAADGLARIGQPQRLLLRWPIRCRDFVELAILAERPLRPAGGDRPAG